MLSKLKTLFQVLFLALIWYLLLNANLFLYALEQAKGQFTIIANTKNVNELMLLNSTPDSVKLELSYIYRIRKFAFDSLGLNYSKNYTTFFDQEGKPLVWVVTACNPFSLEAFEWNYSFLGKMPYKGFFKKEKALVEFYKLKKMNYDVSLGTVRGFSTLGWFQDPVLSGMLNNTEAELAELLLHELTHSTLFVKDSVIFNENLAQFIGEKGTQQYLASYYGKNSKQFIAYALLKKQETLLDSIVAAEATQLDKFYKSANFKTKSVSEKLRLKQEFINRFASKIELYFGKNRRTARLVNKIKKNQNTFFMQFIRYNSKQKSFELELQQNYNGEITEYLTALKLKHST